MILFTSGFPYAGKTEFSNVLKDMLNNEHILHINPKDYYPDDFSELEHSDKMEIAITAWEMSLETATKAICAVPNKALIIFDTCCSQSNPIKPLFANAKRIGHDVLMVFINTESSVRFQRTNDEQIKKVEDKYKSNFKDTLPVLKGLSDYFYIIDGASDFKNNQRVADVAGKVREIRNEQIPKDGRIYQSASTHSTTTIPGQEDYQNPS